MSRPFSYNDEKFTVMGSLLIIHIAFSGVLHTNDIISKIPLGIAKRLKYSGFVGSYNRSPYSPIGFVKFYIRDDFLCISQDGEFDNGQFFAIVDLKDI